MDRRSVIKQILVGVGATLSVTNVEHCWAVVKARPQQGSQHNGLLSLEDAHLTNLLCSQLLPTHDLPEVNQTELFLFVESAMKLTLTKGELQNCLKGMEEFKRLLEQKIGGHHSGANTQVIENILFDLLNVNSKHEKQIISRSNNRSDFMLEESKINYMLYEYLLTVRKLLLIGFYTSSWVSKNLLNHLPIPSDYDPCIDLDDVPNGHSWSF